jgi:CubicO group peptidase (beta-lactamase class C family)
MNFFIGRGCPRRRLSASRQAPLAVRTTPGVVRMMGSVGQFSWPGASGTDWWVDPREELAVVYLSAAPGPIRWHYRQKINALVYQAIVE